MFDQLPAKRLCAHRGLSAALPENSLPALVSAAALGASEVEFDLRVTADGEIVSVHDAALERVSDGTGRVDEHTLAELSRLDFGMRHGPHWAGLRILRFEDVLRALGGRVVMNLDVKDRGGAWEEDAARRLVALIDRFGARRHVYFKANDGELHEQLARLAPDIPRCMGNGAHNNKSRPDIVDSAIEHRCAMVQRFKPHFDEELLAKAREAGLRVNVFFSDDPEEARRYLAWGADTILTNDWLPMSVALGLR